MKLTCTKPQRLVLLVATLVFIVDQAQKWAMLRWIYPDQPPPIHVTDFFSLVMVWNRGVSFGMFNRGEATSNLTSYGVLAVTLLITAMLARLAWRTEHKLERIGYAMAIGGALGNVIDRLHYGAVADFFYFHIGHLAWPAFNIADSAICIGVFILLIALARTSKVPA